MFLKSVNKFKYLKMYLPFWLFLTLFKFGGDIHAASMSPFGERVLPIWVVGLVIGGASFLQLVFDVPAGFILDKYGYKKFLKVTVLLFILSVAFLLLDLNIYTYLLTLFLSSFGWLFYNPGVNAYVLSHAPKEESGKFISFRDIFDSTGVVLATVTFAFIINFPTKIIALIALIILIATYISISMAPKDTVSVHVEKKIETQSFYVKRHFLNKLIKAMFKLDPASWLLLLTSLSSSIFYAIIWFVIPLVVAHSEKSMIMSFSLGIFDVAVVFTGFWLGRFVDRFNKRMLVFFGLLIFAIAGMFLGFNFGFLFLLLGFLATTGDEISSLSLWSWLYTLDKNHSEDGVVSGVVNLFHDLGWAIGPILAGFLYFELGPKWTIAIGGCLVLIVWILYTFKFGKIHSKFNIDPILVPKKPHKSRSKK